MKAIYMSKQDQRSLVDQEGALQRLGGDHQLFNEFITIFVEDFPTLLDEIRSGLATGDASSVEKSAHSYKGLVSNFGAKECVELALNLELAGRAGDVSECDEEFGKLEALNEQLVDQLKEIG